MGKDKMVTIVIVNYNVKQLLLTCIASIYKYSSDLTLEIIVVDNNSTDGSVEALRQQFPAVVVVENNFNAGFPAANNQAFAIAKGEYVLMLNPDTELKDNAIEALINCFEKEKDVALMGPRLLNTNGSLQYSAWRFPRIKYIVAEMLYLNSLIPGKYYLDKDLGKSFCADSLSGAAILFSKQTLEKLGGLNEYLFWIEDIDFCYRANEQGMKVMYMPEVEIIHHIGQSAKKNYNVSISNQVFNKIKFYKVHYGPLETFLVIVLSVVDALFRAIVFGMLSPFNKKYYLKSKAYFYTLVHLFNPPAGIKK